MNSRSQRGRSLSSKLCSSSAREALTSRSEELSRLIAMLKTSVAVCGCRGKWAAKLPGLVQYAFDLNRRNPQKTIGGWHWRMAAQVPIDIAIILDLDRREHV